MWTQTHAGTRTMEPTSNRHQTLSLPGNWPLNPPISSCLMQRCTCAIGSLSWSPDITVSPVVGLDLPVPVVANWQASCYLSLSQTYGYFNTCLLSSLPYVCHTLTHISTPYAHSTISSVADIQKYGPVMVPLQLMAVVLLCSFESVQMILVWSNLTIYLYITFPSVFYRFYIKE